MIGKIDEPGFRYDAALYFLAGGHYLFRTAAGGKSFGTKFVTARDVAAAFTQHDEDSGWLPAGVVRVGHCAKGPWYVYSAPGQKVKVLFSTGEATIPIPRTVMLGVGRDYYLWAMRSSSFEHGAAGYNAPFPNVYETGKICWGQNKPQEADAQKARGMWEMFFRTPFNNDLSNRKCRTFPANVTELYPGLKGKFPVDELVETGGTMQTLINRVVEVRDVR